MKRGRKCMRFESRTEKTSPSKIFAFFLFYILLAGVLLSVPTISYPLIKANMKPEYRYSLVFPFDDMDYYGNDDAPDQVMYHVNLWNKSQVGRADITYITSSNAAFINVTNIRNITINSRAIFKDECRRIFGFYWHDDTNYYKTYFLEMGMLRVNVTILDSLQKVERLILNDVPPPQGVRWAENDTDFKGYTYSGCDYYTSVPESPCNMKIWFIPPPPPGKAPVVIAKANRTNVHDHQPILFDASSSYDPDGQILEYIWDFGDGNYSYNVTEEHEYTYNGSVTYGVYLIVKDNEQPTGLMNRTKLFIDVNKPDTEPPKAEAGPDVILTEDESHIFDGTNSSDNSGIVKYLWYFGDGSCGIGSKQAHSYSHSGKYTATLFVYDDAGYMDADVANITVLNVPPKAEAGPDREAGLKQPVKFDGGKSLDTPSDLLSLLYFWDFEDGGLGIGKSVIHSFMAPGIYKVNLTVRDDDGSEGYDECIITVTNRTNLPPVILPIADVYVRLNYPWLLNLTPYVWDEDTANLQIVTNSSFVYPSQKDNLLLIFNYTNPNLLHEVVNITASDGEYTGSQTVNVTVSLTNFPPRMEEGMELPDLVMLEDVPRANVFNMKDYFVDNVTDVLNFTHLSNPYVFATIQNGWVSLSSLKDWHGYTSMTFKAEDMAGAWVQDTIQVAVLPVNDPPVVVQQITFTLVNEGGVWSIDLDDYFYDVDDANLNYSCNKPNITINPSTHEAKWVPQKGEYYLENIIFTASDKEYNVSTKPINITVIKRPVTPLLPSWAIVIIGFAIGILFVFAYRALRYRYRVEELFVLDKGGILLTHVSRWKVKKIDKDIVGAMLTAVQQFVKDAFVKGKKVRKRRKGVEALEAIEYGDLWIVIENGKYIHLAVVISGYDNPRLRGAMKKVIGEIETKYENTLKYWDGNMAKLRGIKKIAEKLVKRERKWGK